MRLPIIRLHPHLHLILYLVAVIIAMLPVLFPKLSSLEARSRKEYIKASEDDQPLNLSKYSKDSLEADMSHAGESIISKEATENSDGQTYYRYGGAAVVLAQGIGYVAVNPPATTGEYLADLLQNTRLAPQAYAQGLGFSSLSPVLDIWKAFRSVAYFLYIIVFIVIGFMIMFRAHIDHQTVVTIQAALPKLLITLVLITFSYAIAGFIVDLIYLLGMGAISLFELTGIIEDGQLAINAFFGLSIFRIGLKYFISPMEVAGDTANAVSAIAQGIVGLPGGLFDWILDALFYLIIAIAILIAMFRTFFGLLTAYIGIIIAVIFAPVQLLLNAFPGSNTFGSWIRGLAANAAVFPAVIIMVIIGAYLAGGDSVQDLGVAPSGDQRAGFGFGEGGGGGGTGFVPPLITSSGITWVAQGEVEEFGPRTIQAIIGLGFIMLLPEVVKIVKGALKVEESKYGEAALANFQRGWGTVRAPFAIVGGAATQIGMSYTSQNIGNWYTQWRKGRATNRDVNASAPDVAPSQRQTHTQYNRARLQQQGLSTKTNLSPSGNEDLRSEDIS